MNIGVRTIEEENVRSTRNSWICRQCNKANNFLIIWLYIPHARNYLLRRCSTVNSWSVQYSSQLLSISSLCILKWSEISWRDHWKNYVKSKWNIFIVYPSHFWIAGRVYVCPCKKELITQRRLWRCGYNRASACAICLVLACHGTCHGTFGPLLINQSMAAQLAAPFCGCCVS